MRVHGVDGGKVGGLGEGEIGKVGAESFISRQTKVTHRLRKAQRSL